jgi:hypothetical protein
VVQIAVDIEGYGEQHRAMAGGMVIALERWTAGLDTTEMFAGLPDGACQEPHFGYVLDGSATVHYTDGSSETLTTGDAYYLKPGHNVHIDQDAEFVEFTRADDAPGINRLQA